MIRFCFGAAGWPDRSAGWHKPSATTARQMGSVLARNIVVTPTAGQLAVGARLPPNIAHSTLHGLPDQPESPPAPLPRCATEADRAAWHDSISVCSLVAL